ncbi:MAG: leucine-rich repeat domain-containing protein [Bacteroidaceae bacterium]|nr:leucine-rich repeat domain-containing protein [Bacteroidaceae bacterium]
MANWIPVYYALTGSKEELLDIESKINQVEQTAREKQKAEGSDWTGCEIEHFARLIGSELTYADLGGYWNYDSNALEWKQTDDGEEYLLWIFINKHWENPRMREMIEGAYSSVKIFYEAPAGDTNDKEERYFVPRIKLTNVDGLNYVLGKDGTAILNCDNCIKGKVLRIPEQIEYNGTTYQVTSFGDVFADPQYGSNTIDPEELEEVFFPASIKSIYDFAVCLPTLKAIHFAGDIDVIDDYAFASCRQLSIVEFAGKVNSIGVCAFEDTAIEDIQIPEGTRVDPDAFEDSPFGNKNSQD